ncbi:MAG: hypothetical protein ACTJHT_10670 [Sphingobacterium sp.]|uniref:hypothetical protein n=1 Tax=Sphingobacterium sp. JB170 TaxID=1434842 RepID=UPI0015C663A4|nr:hypothetical protein [Sphingobacterium sp. JB170]
MGPRIEYVTATEITQILRKDNEQIDLFEFGGNYIDGLQQEGRHTTYSRRKSTFMRFNIFVGKPTFSPDLMI